MEGHNQFSKPESLCGPEIYDPSTDTSEVNLHDKDKEELRETVEHLKVKIDFLEAEITELKRQDIRLQMKFKESEANAISKHQELQAEIQFLKEDIAKLKNLPAKKNPGDQGEFESQCGLIRSPIGASKPDKAVRNINSSLDKMCVGDLRALNFRSTRSIAVAFVIENFTSATLEMHENYFSAVQYEEVVLEIPPNNTKAFGLTLQDYLNGLISYRVYDKLFVIYYKSESQIIDANYIALAFIPMNWAKMKSGKDLHWKMTVPDEENYWDSPDVAFKKVITQDFKLVKQLNAMIQLGNLQASAAVMTGSKSIVTIKLSEI